MMFCRTFGVCSHVRPVNPSLRPVVVVVVNSLPCARQAADYYYPNFILSEGKTPGG